jgi:hypothetical protein
MKFRLTYAGPLLSSKPLDKDQRDKRIEHKHRIRRHFHKQLKQYWLHQRFLLTHSEAPAPMFSILPEVARLVWADDPNTRRPLPELLGPVFGHSGYKFIPLVWKENSVACSLRILCLRRDTENAVLPVRDLDNRVKTLIDALTMPLPKQGSPLENGSPLAPQEDEDPFFVLLDDDRQITHLEVETDAALELNEKNPSDESFVRLVISVEIKPYTMTMFNLSFA